MDFIDMVTNAEELFQYGHTARILRSIRACVRSSRPTYTLPALACPPFQNASTAVQ